MSVIDIRKWVGENAKALMQSTHFSISDLDHITMCMEHIYAWYHYDYPVGGFLTAVLKDNFMEACLHADDINRKALYLYALFLANKIPSDYKRKALKK